MFFMKDKITFDICVSNPFAVGIALDVSNCEHTIVLTHIKFSWSVLFNAGPYGGAYIFSAAFANVHPTTSTRTSCRRLLRSPTTSARTHSTTTTYDNGWSSTFNCANGANDGCPSVGYVRHAHNSATGPSPCSPNAVRRTGHNLHPMRGLVFGCSRKFFCRCA